ncbi:MAG TPA: CBS domain-containing protein [Gemmatimonadaceae bacterium]|nr:CBS domain-containing protein [Gemmatimonadaceae bacterium]
MNLGQLITAERAVVPLGAATVTDAAEALVERLSAAGALASPEKLRERVTEERAEDIVAMGDRAFLVHYRTDAVADLAVAIGTSPVPICRDLGDEGDRQCAHVVLLIAAPPRLATRYLQLLGAFARFLSSAERVDALLAARTPRELAALPLFAEYDIPEQLAVRDIMTRQPRTVGPDLPLAEAARTMLREGLGGLPVVDSDGRVVGMLSERELMRHLLTSSLNTGGPRPLASQPIGRRTVRDVMTRQVLCVSPDQPVAEVASLMSNKDVERVPVVREGCLVGFLTRGDIVRKLIGS